MTLRLAKCIAYPFGEGKHLLKASKENNLKKILDLAPDADHTELNYRDESGYTGLHYASERGYTDIAETLLKARASPSIQENFNFTPLLLAARNDHDLIVALLLKHKADVNDHTSYCTALHYTAHEGNLTTAEVLIKNNANVNARDDFGRTPLHMACQQGKKKMVKRLLLYKADTTLRTDQDFMPIHVARKKGYDSIVQMLKRVGVIDSNQGDDSGKKVPRVLSQRTLASYTTQASEVGDNSSSDDDFFTSHRISDVSVGSNVSSASITSSEQKSSTKGSLSRGPKPMFKTHGKKKPLPKPREDFPKGRQGTTQKIEEVSDIPVEFMLPLDADVVKKMQPRNDHETKFEDAEQIDRSTRSKRNGRKHRKQKSKTESTIKMEAKENERLKTEKDESRSPRVDDLQRKDSWRVQQNKRRTSQIAEEALLEKRAKQLRDKRRLREQKEKQFEAERLKKEAIASSSKNVQQFFRVIDREAVCYRHTPSLDDRVSPPNGVVFNEVIEAASIKGNWIQVKNGLWLPMKIGREVMLEPVSAKARHHRRKKVDIVSEGAARYRVVDKQAVCFRVSKNLDDRVYPVAGVKYNEIIESVKKDGNWIQLKNRLWLPLTINKEVMLVQLREVKPKPVKKPSTSLQERMKQQSKKAMKIVKLSRPEDKLGIRLSREEDKYFVTTVEKGLLAHQSGVLQNDEMVEINGRLPPTQKKDLPDRLGERPLLIKFRSNDMYMVVDAVGVAFRKSRNLEDRVMPPAGVQSNEVVCAVKVAKGWIQMRNGYWLPLSRDGQPLLVKMKG